MDDAVVELWSRAAATYETEIPYFGPMGERIAAHAGLEPGQHVLDVACGKGATLLPAAAAVGPDGHVTGIDIVPEMVDRARQAAAAAGLANVSMQVMDGEDLEFADASFDVVIVAFGLGFLRPDRALPEIRRVLRDGGRLVAGAPLGGGTNWDFFGDLCKRYGLESGAHPGGTSVPDFAAIVQLLAKAGLVAERPVTDAVSVRFPDEESWWRWVWSHGQRAYLERLDDSNVAAFKADAFAKLRSFATPEGIPLEQQFVVLRATAELR
jgi:SAM-dependent methyltransferase